MPLINFEISLQLNWSKNCIWAACAAVNQNQRFQINDSKWKIKKIATGQSDDYTT